MKCLRSKILWLVCGLSNWVSDHICYQDYNAPIGWRDHLRWRIEGFLTWLFCLVYEGSDEEVRDGVEFADSDVNPDYLTSVQHEIRTRRSEWL